MAFMRDLSQSKKRLRRISRRPLWKEDKEPEDPVRYPYRYKTQHTFEGALSTEYRKWCEKNAPKTILGRGIYNQYPERFLIFFADTVLNIPNPPVGYGFVTDFVCNNNVKYKIRSPIKSLAEKLGPIGVMAFDPWRRCFNSSFPVAFLEILERVTKENPSFKEDRLIVEALLKYRANLLSRHTEHLKSFGHKNTTTQACMDVSLAEEIQNFRAFWANRDNLLASAGQ